MQSKQEGITIVLAGSNKEYERYCKLNGLTPENSIYAFNSEKIIDVIAKKIVVVGTFYSRPQAGEIKKVAESRLIK